MSTLIIISFQVYISENYNRYYSRCYALVDPHMGTFDHRLVSFSIRIEHQEMPFDRPIVFGTILPVQNS